MSLTRFDKVLFITPYSPGRYFGGLKPPVGIGYVEEFVASYGVATSALDMTTGLKLRHLISKIAATSPALVGFTVMSYQYSHTLNMISQIKHHFPQIKIVAGGPHVCALKGNIMQQCPELDFAVAGEGEYSLRDLCLGLPFPQIPGLYYREAGEVKQGAPRAFIQDLDTLPFPRYASYPLHKYTDEIEINTSRGCPHECIFCAVSNIMGKQVRYRSATNVVDELEFWHRQGRRTFQVGDDNFLASRQRIGDILAEIRGRHLQGLLLRCGQGVRADLLDREILLDMKQVGFQHLGIGVESASDRVLEVIRKKTTLAKIEPSIALACELGFDVTLLFVVGTPTETLADVKASIHLAEKYPVMKAFFFNLIPFPGTRLFDWVMENNALLKPYDQLINRSNELKLRSTPFFATLEMPVEDRLKALALTEKASKNIQVRTLKRKFSKLGPFGSLLAQLGRFDFLERWFVGNKLLRHFADFVVFR